MPIKQCFHFSNWWLTQWLSLAILRVIGGASSVVIRNMSMMDLNICRNELRLFHSDVCENLFCPVEGPCRIV